MEVSGGVKAHCHFQLGLFPSLCRMCAGRTPYKSVCGSSVGSHRSCGSNHDDGSALDTTLRAHARRTIDCQTNPGPV